MLWLGSYDKVTGCLLVGKSISSSYLVNLSNASMRLKLLSALTTVVRSLNMEQVFALQRTFEN